MKKRVFIALFLCLVIVLSLATFTACDNQNALSDDDNNNETPIDLEKQLSILESLVAYVNEMNVGYDITYFENIDYVDNTYVKSKILKCYCYPDDADERKELLSCLFMDSAEDARATLETISRDGWNIFTDGNIIVTEPEEGLYNKIKSKHLSTLPEQLEFAIAPLKGTDTSSYRYLYLYLDSYYDSSLNKNILQTSMVKLPAQGNCEMGAECCIVGDNKQSYIDHKKEIEQHKYSTDDSFVDFVTIDNVEYARYYLKYKPCMLFEEYEDGYMLDECRYNTTSITIPTTHNGKQVLGIATGSISSDHGLTDITFEGTKAQWNALEKEENYFGNITIHCTDGDIAPVAK